MNSSESTASTGRFELILEEQAVPAKVGHGYDPYETWPSVGTPDSTTRHADLRRLSEWIRLRRQVSQLKKSDG